MESSSVVVYPVPNDGQFIVTLKNPGPSPYVLKVINAVGETMFEQRGISGMGELKIPVDLGNPTAGIYLLTIENDKQRLMRKVVVR